MNDSNWQKYTETGNSFLSKEQKCCAYRFYQSALTEAEQMLMNSFEVENIDIVVPALMISYQNLFNLLDSENCYEDLCSYLSRATERFAGTLHSPEFPETVQENCCRDIHKLYHSLDLYGQKYPIIYKECQNCMRYLKEAILYFALTLHGKKN